MATAEDLDFFLMANLSPRLTGLPFVVWISPRGNAQHDVQVKISPGPKAVPEEMVSAGIRPDVHIVEGNLPTRQFEALRQWVELNRDVLIRYWDGDISYTEEVLSLLRPITANR